MDTLELNKVYSSKKATRNKLTGDLTKGFVTTTFQQFTEWFQKSNIEKGCYYCGTTNEQTFELYQQQLAGLRYNATRGGKRGKRLEIDRKDPKQPYDNLDNLVWCCYWCNNAKSNFFTTEEFAPIAKAIGEAIKNLK